MSEKRGPVAEKLRSSRRIIAVAVLFSLVFAAMLGYFVYFVGVEASAIIGNPYNARMDVFNQRYVRGAILADDGTALAQTQLDAEGREQRVYPYGPLFAHVVGYSQKGKTGLEANANFYLQASHAQPLIKLWNELEERKSQGDSVKTSLNIRLQQLAREALGEQRGAVIAMEPSSGRVLAMYASPAFDPNRIEADWESLSSGAQDDGILLNRAAQGLYPPGSVFKMLTLLEYIREGHDPAEFSFTCKGEFANPENPDEVIHCFQNEAHGKQNLEEAFANSCNSAFASMALQLDRERFGKTASDFLFNQQLPFALPSAVSRFNLSRDSSNWDIMQASIGQGTVLMSPLHVALLTEAVANDGVCMPPTLLTEVLNPEQETVERLQPRAGIRLMSPEEAALLKGYMRAVVSEGTASALRTDAYEAAGKTGSAEYLQGGKKKTHAWFTGFAPLKEPRIAVTVLVEDGKTGGSTAAPIVRRMLDAYLEEK